MNRKQIAILLISILLTTFILISCDKQPSTVSKSKITITVNSWVGWAPLYLAKEKKLFGNTEVEIVRVEDTGARKSTMIAGKVDGYGSSLDSFAIDSTEGVDGKVVLCIDESFGADGIVAKKDIKNLNGLKGKKIAFQKGMPAHFLLLLSLDKAGLKPSDVIQLDMDGDKAGAAFTSGKLDAAVTWEPWISKAASMANGKILLTTKEFPGMIVDVLVFRNEVLANKKGAIKDIANGWFKALEYWKTNKDVADGIMARTMGLKTDEFNEMIRGVRFFDLAHNAQYLESMDKQGKGYEVFEKASQLWYSAGIIKAKKDPKDLIDPTFISGIK